MALLRLKYFLLLCIFISLQGCQTTKKESQQNQDDQPKIFNHFEPNLSYQEKTSEQLDVSPTAALPSSKVSIPASEPTSDDLWQHIANNLSLVFQTNKQTTARVKWYLKQPEYLETVNRRAAPYLYHIVKRVEKQNLPMELALLPFVESDFRPTVRSSEHAVVFYILLPSSVFYSVFAT